MTPTEREYLGLDDQPTGAEKILALAILAGGIWAMKKISNHCSKSRGEKEESWIEWLTRKSR